MKNVKTTKQKKDMDIIKAYERGELKTVANFNKIKKQYSQIARNTLKKDKSITIRIAERDLLRIKEKAMKEGIQYQTLISSLIHKNVS